MKLTKEEIELHKKIKYAPVSCCRVCDYSDFLPDSEIEYISDMENKRYCSKYNIHVLTFYNCSGNSLNNKETPDA